ncbi:MAG: hypothetical protein JNK29_03755 [Anaerolineales bacterium]|nr:hypothetical protein [Anaerolineales bacterium]
MIRPFDWRDVSLIRQLSDQGTCLDSITRLTRDSQPLNNALLAYLMPGTGAPTLVWRDGTRAGFGQLRHRPGEEQARALFVAPAWSPENAAWLPLVDRLAQEAGARGGHNLIAEVDEASGEFEALRLAGFAIYARQTIWRLAGELKTVATAHARPAAAADGVAVTTLYTNLVPRLVQQVEPAPKPGRGYVYERAGELIAFLDVKRGPTGLWVEPYLHPEADNRADEILQAALGLLAGTNRAGRPIYVCVRRYQDWLQSVLQAADFECLGSQAVMVKRLAVRVSEPVLKPLPTLEGSATTTPIAGARLDIYPN